MLVRGIRFGPIINAAGAQGFFGEGYPNHKWWKLAGLTFEGEDFNSKTLTLGNRAGNMPLDPTDKITPQEMMPKCIKCYFWRGETLNAVGLSNPGLPWALEQGRLQTREKPFSLSLMTVNPTAGGRLEETKGIVHFMRDHKKGFQTQFAIEWNRSCPNQHESTGDELIDETSAQLDLLAELDVPIIVKVSIADVTPQRACQLSQHSACDGLTISNSIGFGKLPDQIDWEKKFPHGSPLAKYGGGGLSGAPLFPLVRDFIKELRELTYKKMIWACGGIMCRREVRIMAQVGANGVQSGVVNILRPHRKRGIIQEAYNQFR